MYDDKGYDLSDAGAARDAAQVPLLDIRTRQAAGRSVPSSEMGLARDLLGKRYRW